VGGEAAIDGRRIGWLATQRVTREGYVVDWFGFSDLLK